MESSVRCNVNFIALAIALLFCDAARAEPRMEKLDLFTADTLGYRIFRIPGLIVTTKGTLLAYCEARMSDKTDWGTIDIFMRRSTDAGKTWELGRKITKAPKVDLNSVVKRRPEGAAGVTVNNPVAIADRSGAVHLLYCVEYARCFYMRSDDDGRTFSTPVEVTAAFEQFRPEYDWKVIATGPGHGIQLRGGRLLVPVWLSTSTNGAHRPSAVASIYSDDQGKSWKRGAIVVNHPTPANPSETAAVELSDGRVMFNIRHESTPRVRGVSISADGASQWSAIRFDPQLPDPVCMGSLIRIDEKRIALSNLHNEKTRDRVNLTIKISQDDGKTWPTRRTLEPGASAYSDLAVGPDGSIYCLYERGGDKSQSRYQFLTLAKFNLDWLETSE